MILPVKPRVITGNDKCHDMCTYWLECMGTRNRTGKCPQHTMMSPLKSIIEINLKRRKDNV
jgi:hypothetical protein